VNWVMPGGPGGAVALAVLVAVAVVAPLPLAARYPLMGWRIGWLALLLVPMVTLTGRGEWPWGPTQLLVLVVVFCAAGVRVSRAALWWMWALTLAVWSSQVAAGHPGLLTGVAGTLVLTVAAVASDALGAWRRARRALASQAEQTELEQARRAVLEERAKIARELHDVVAHHMSLIAVRAETAPYRLAGLPAGALEEFASLSGGAREALADMRRLLGVLRHDQARAGPAPALALAPQPQLADLPGLIGTARQAGMGVEFRQAAGPGPEPASPVPPPVGVCAYRIVQESLSNASRHAPGAPVTVTIGHHDDAVLLRVENGPAAPRHGRQPALLRANGHGPAASHDRVDSAGPAGGRYLANGRAPASGTGHGLAGMRERVTLLGGSLSAGPSPAGGFVVSAVLPTGQPA
jgi:signal transduction histidine kinase